MTGSETAPTPNPIPVTVAYGDGIGPEIMEAALRVLEAARTPLEYRTIRIGKDVYEQGVSTGIPPEAWETIRSTRAFLKAPITTPQGGGYKSLNVTVRKSLGLYANVRPAVSYAPFVRTKHPSMDVVIIRENEEDLYGGIEHRQTDDVTQCLKLITRPGTERIVRYAFEYARANGRRKVTCFTKDNIMKLTDGLFSQIFRQVAAEYPDLESEHWIIDIGAAKLADTPEVFDVIVTTNLYGDIISDIAAQVAGSVGLAPSANIGDRHAMFEAIHGSAPDIAGKGIANPSGLLLAAVMMLQHVGLPEHAALVHNAWLTTIEDGVHTVEIFEDGISRERVGTAAFADAVIARLGQEPKRLRPVRYRGVSAGAGMAIAARASERPPARKEMVGVDVFLHWPHQDPERLAAQLTALQDERLRLVMITNRGVKVWPEGLPETYCTDHWRCRFESPSGEPIAHRDVLALLGRIAEAGLDFVKTESLCTFDGERGYALGQGQ